MNQHLNPFPELVDLACEAVGAEVLAASDEFFGPKEDLIKTSAPVVAPEQFTAHGRWVDGWETQRRRGERSVEGHDWCIIKLGLPGAIRAVAVDPSHFQGELPSYVSLEAAVLADGTSIDGAVWKPVLGLVRLQGGIHNYFELPEYVRSTHVRFNLHPDGGVARLHVYGKVSPDWDRLRGSGEAVDLASVVNGGTVIGASDSFFGSRGNLIAPGRPSGPGQGWETRRRRGPGYDWIVVKLGQPCVPEAIQVETEFYRGNFPEACSIDSCFEGEEPEVLFKEDLLTGRIEWRQILPQTELTAHTVHRFERELAGSPMCSHVRLNIYPDGGISRLRVFAKVR